MSSRKKENYSWKLSPILRTFQLYWKHSFYKTLLFSMFFYPLPVLFNLDKQKIKFRKNKILEKEVRKYVSKKYGIYFKKIEGPFALVALLEIFLKDIYDYFEVKEKDVVYDLGATVGEYSLKAAKRGAFVLAFEQDKKVYSAMVENIEANEFEKKIIPFNCRIDNKKNSLDSFFNKTKKAPAIMKIDIEGDELKALNGAKKILKNHKPKLIIETHSKKLMHGCLNFLKPIGYKTVHQIDMYSKNKETKLLFLEHLA